MNIKQKQQEYNYLKNKAVLFYETANFEKAEIYYNKILEEYPGDTKILSMLGELYYCTNRNKLAIKCFEKVLKDNPEDAGFFNNYGNSLILENKISEAINFYKKAIETDKNYLKPWNNLGKTYLETEDYNQALNYYGYSLKLKNNQAEVHNNIGIIYEKLGYFHDAISSYCNAIILNADFIHSYFNLGVLFSKINSFEDSEDSFRTAIKKDRKNYLFYIYFGKMLLKAKKFYDAENPYKDYLRVFPEDNKVKLSLSYIQIRTKQFLKAKETIDSVSADNKILSEIIHYQKALINIFEKNYKEAVLNLNKVLKYNPLNPQSLYYKNYCFLIENDGKENIKIINLNQMIYVNKISVQTNNLTNLFNILKNDIENYPFKIKNNSNQNLIKNGYIISDYTNKNISFEWLEVIIRQEIHNLIYSKLFSDSFKIKKFFPNKYKIIIDFIKLNPNALYTPDMQKKSFLNGLLYIGETKKNSSEISDIIEFGIANNLEINIDKEKFTAKSLKTTPGEIIIFPEHIAFNINNNSAENCENYYAHFKLISIDR